MRLIIEENDAKAGLWTARYIVARIKEKAARTDRPFVLGLPTGSTPVETYKELVRLYEAGEVSFRNVVTFNMDEYVGIPEDHPESYHTFMLQAFLRPCRRAGREHPHPRRQRPRSAKGVRGVRA